ncbi:MAG: leucine-rich repeat protein, partial [Acutalibacteraceae bacterium]
MQSFKRIISILATVAMLITTLTVTASVSVYAEDTAVQAPVYFTKFTADNFVGYGEYARNEDGYEYDEGNTADYKVQEAGSVTYLADGAVDIATKSTESKGVRLIYKLDDTAKNYFSQLEDEAEAKYQENVNAAKENAEKLGKEFNVNSVATVYPSVKCRFFINEAVTAKDVDTDALISIAFVLKDGSLTDAIIGGGVKYATKDITVPIRKEVIVDGETVYSSVDLEDIEAVRLEVFHWNSSLKEVTFSGLTVSRTGELPEREAIEVGDENTCVAVNWDKNYRRSYAPEPKEFLYSAIENPEGEDGAKSGFNKRGDAGWMKFKTVSTNRQYQTAFWFDRDQFDYALALANRKDKNGKLIGSGKFVMSLALESCTDSKGEPVKAEVKVFFSTTHNGYITLADEWQEPGTTVQYKLDVSQIERSDVEMVIISVQNTWYYDENGELVEYPESGKEVSIDLGNGETSNTIKYGTGVTSVGGIMPQVKVSPITVFDPTAPITTTTTTEETKNDFEYEILSDGTVAITGYTGNGGIVEIPSKIDGKTVTSIGFCAFEFCTSLTSVTIPDTVTSIDFSAFSDC